jgi:hypothetical protein
MKSSTSTKFQFNISRSTATVLVSIYDKCLTPSKTGKVVTALERFQRKVTKRDIFKGREAEVCDNLYNAIQILHRDNMYNNEEYNEEDDEEETHDAIIRTACHRLEPEYDDDIYTSVSYLNWAVYNKYIASLDPSGEDIVEYLEDNCVETNTCTACKVTRYTTHYFSTCYGLDEPVCGDCVDIEYAEDDDENDEDYVVEEEEEDDDEEEEEEDEEEEEEKPEKKKSTGKVLSMTARYMNFSPNLVNERNKKLNECPTKSGRCEIYKEYYLKMKKAFNEAECEDEADECDDDCECAEASKADASEADASEADDVEEEECPDCDVEWRTGWHDGWKAAMKYMRRRATEQYTAPPAAPICANCRSSIYELLKCSGSCGGKVRYCSTDCQKTHWKSHKYMCGKDID